MTQPPTLGGSTLKRCLSVCISIGDEVAGVSSGSVIKCRVSDGVKPNTWSAGISNFCNNLVLVSLVTPPDTVLHYCPRYSADSIVFSAVAKFFGLIFLCYLTNCCTNLSRVKLPFPYLSNVCKILVVIGVGNRFHDRIFEFLNYRKIEQNVCQHDNP